MFPLAKCIPGRREPGSRARQVSPSPFHPSLARSLFLSPFHSSSSCAEQVLEVVVLRLWDEPGKEGEGREGGGRRLGWLSSGFAPSRPEREGKEGTAKVQEEREGKSQPCLLSFSKDEILSRENSCPTPPLLLFLLLCSLLLLSFLFSTLFDDDAKGK